MSSDAYLQRVRSGEQIVKNASLKRTESHQEFAEVRPERMMNESQEPSKITDGIPVQDMRSETEQKLVNEMKRPMTS